MMGFFCHFSTTRQLNLEKLAQFFKIAVHFHCSHRFVLGFKVMEKKKTNLDIAHVLVLTSLIIGVIFNLLDLVVVHFFITMILNIPWKVTVWPLMFKFAILLAMAPCSICSTSSSEGRLALKATLMVIWTLVPPMQDAETYNTFITYVVEFLVNKSLICQKKE